MPTIIAWKILQAYDQYEHFQIIIMGGKGYGKSSFAIKLCREIRSILRHPDWRKYVMSTWDNWQRFVNTEVKPLVKEEDWEAWREWMVFTEDQVDLAIGEAHKSGKQQPLLVWDDAGVSASKQRHAEDFAKALTEYLDVARTDFAGIVYTTPKSSNLLKGIRTDEELYKGRIIKLNKFERIIRVYKWWESLDEKTRGVEALWQERFNKLLPDWVFAGYDAVRRRYSEVPKEKLHSIIEEMQKLEGRHIKQIKDRVAKMMSGDEAKGA